MKKCEGRGEGQQQQQQQQVKGSILHIRSEECRIHVPQGPPSSGVYQVASPEPRSASPYFPLKQKLC